jgi:hypothetical protein
MQPCHEQTAAQRLLQYFVFYVFSMVHISERGNERAHVATQISHVIRERSLEIDSAWHSECIPYFGKEVHELSDSLESVCELQYVLAMRAHVVDFRFGELKIEIKKYI